MSSKGLNNDQRRQLRRDRIKIINTLISNGRSVHFDIIWNALYVRGKTEGLKKDSFRGSLFKYGVSIKNGMVSQKGGEVVETIAPVDKFEVVDTINWVLKLFYAVSAKLRRTFQDDT